jgi:hypothetical protein
MLQMRPNCEVCDRDLGPEDEARICSFECTFCPACAEGMAMRCPNCGGVLERRPTRRAELLGRHPASTERVLRRPP